MSITIIKQIAKDYSEQVEHRPFSRFTQKPEEQKENVEWYKRALVWAEHPAQKTIDGFCDWMKSVNENFLKGEKS